MRDDPTRYSTLMKTAPARARSTPLHLGLFTSARGAIESRPCAWHRLSLRVGDLPRASRGGRRNLGADEIAIVPAGDSGVWVDEAPARTFVMCLKPQFLDRIAEDSGARFALEPGSIQDSSLARIASALRVELESGQENGRIYVDGLALAFCARLTARLGSPVAASTGKALSNGRLNRVKAYVEAHLDQDLSLARIAAVAGSSPSHFKVLFQRATGLPLHRYVVGRRVERARELLERTGMSLDEVAAEVGFAHQTHLARWTQRLLGASPRQLTLRRGEPQAQSGLR